MTFFQLHNLGHFDLTSFAYIESDRVPVNGLTNVPNA